MKAKIVITPKKAVLDPQGKTVQTALEHMGYDGVKAFTSANTSRSNWRATPSRGGRRSTRRATSCSATR
jgi:hypothetical protein